MAFVLMKIFEESPRRFDRGMQILTLGRLAEIRERIVERLVEPGTDVLEIGCGTGFLLRQMAARGARVVGIDTAGPMVEAARDHLAQLDGQAEVRKLHALQVEDEFEPGSFDRVVSVLALSEMTDDEIDCLLPQCRRVLRSRGRLILADEAEPDSFWRRLVYRLYRHAARLVTYLGLQAVELKKANPLLKVLYFVIEFPLMLLAFVVAPPLTHPLERLDERLERAGFQVVGVEKFLGGSLQLLAAEATS
ncbi:MAG TPA: corrinoid protein-associated methyltransferase CpaM [Thermoanaerobaculia bacterium]|jgi:ubiquinone/menaquinone biosynthesis C-methylase UbiE